MDHDEEFQWLFLAEYPAVVRTTYLVLHDHARAEEIAQDAFVQLLRHWERVRDYESPQGWLRRVAIRLAVREAQRDRRREWLTRRQPPPPTSTAPDDLADPELMAAIGRLSPQQRSVVVLFYFEDQPMEAIADILGCSASTGWVHLHRARKRLGALLSEEVDTRVD